MRKHDFLNKKSASIERSFLMNDSVLMAKQLLRLARTFHFDFLRCIQNNPLKDEIADFGFKAVNEHFVKNSGFLYLAANANNPGFYKIGLTKKEPSLRMKSLNNAGVVGELVLIKSYVVHDRFYLESLIHKKLEKFVLKHKEFFYSTWETLDSFIQKEIDTDIKVLEDYYFLSKN